MQKGISLLCNTLGQRHLVQDLNKEKEEDGSEVVVDVARNREDVLPEREFQLDDPQHS